jgi:uncharacterized protein (DUF2236 family)
VLLQLAHPLVAAGVAEHSDFREDPLRRLVATINTSLAVTFGDRAQAAAAAEAVRRVHEHVAGRLPQAQGPWEAGTAYRAGDPELALWVFATLVETGLDGYELFVAPLTPGDRCRYYAESAPFAAAFGAGPPVLPATYEEFRDYYGAMVRERLVIGDLAREQARAVLRARLGGLPVAPPAVLLAGLLLPPRVRAAYRVPPVPRVAAAPVRRVIAAAPPAARYWPAYLSARRRVAAPTAG